jgi:hypothetical protein
MPLSASTVSPLSSATAAIPVACTASTALASAFSAKVAPVSGPGVYGGTSVSPSTSTCGAVAASSRRISVTLPGLAVARTTLIEAVTA